MEEVVELTKSLVQFKTTKRNKGELNDCIDFIEDYFSSSDFVNHRYEKNGKPSLVVSFEDTKKPEVMLHGHIDVIEASEEMFEPEVQDGKIYGRGSADMKAGVACLMKVMKDLADLEEKPSVGLMIVSDEEIGGFDGAGYLFGSAGYRPDFAVSAEPNNMDGYLDIVAKQKGILQVELKTTGKNAHGSRPWQGENAADKLIEKYQKVKKLFPSGEEKTWETTSNLGKIESGDAPNQVPPKASMKLDIRYSENYQSEEVLEDLESIQNLEVEAILNEPMLNNDLSNNYIKMLQESGESVVESCSVTRKEAGSDMRFLTRENIPAVVFGPEGYGVHGPGEYAVISSMEDYVDILHHFLTEQI